MICYRKHTFLDQKYQIYNTEDKLIIGKSLDDAKYQLSKNLDTYILWHLNSSNKEFKGFSIIYKKEQRRFQMSHKNCSVLKQQLDGQLIYSEINSLYVPIKKLGEGTFAKVIQVVNRIDESEWACKTMKIDKKFSKNVRNMTKFQDMIYEIKTLQSLDHPGIIKVKEVFSCAKYIYIVMELCKGGCLHQFIKYNKLSSEQIIDVMKQVLRAVMYMHSCGFIHRDIKPENILLRNTRDLSNLVICDFGFATTLEDIRTKYPCCGTPGYMAPEVMKYDDSNPYDQQCDVFSCGSLLYQLLTGDQLKVKSEQSVVYDLDVPYINGKLVKKNISSEFLPILLMMLEENPLKRIKAEEALSFFENYDEYNVKQDMDVIQQPKPSHFVKRNSL